MMHRSVTDLARATALLGGFVLLVLIVLTTLSILGRSVNKFLHNDVFDTVLNGPSKCLLDLGIGEINGSYELLEAGVAFAIFSFLADLPVLRGARHRRCVYLGLAAHL